jgi:hypothetical protein
LRSSLIGRVCWAQGICRCLLIIKENGVRRL